MPTRIPARTAGHATASPAVTDAARAWSQRVTGAPIGLPIVPSPPRRPYRSARRFRNPRVNSPRTLRDRFPVPPSVPNADDLRVVIAGRPRRVAALCGGAELAKVEHAVGTLRQ